tara:strand:+ start:7631 stop:8266 length:636 start_codon:yes stop_codon:yes gene_type:complete
MYTIIRKSLSFITIFLAALLSRQGIAQDILVKDKIENFSIMGISLNTTPSELDSLISQHPLQFSCRVEQGGFQFNQKNYAEVYRKCKGKGEKVELTITHSDGRISQINLTIQSQKNYHEAILNDIKLINKELLAAGKVHQQSSPKDSDKDAFFYQNSEMAAGMSDTKLALRAPATCVKQESTFVGLSAQFMIMPGLNNAGVTVSNGRSHLC